MFGELDIPELSARTIIAYIRAYEQTGMIPPALDAAATMPSSEPERLAEAMRRALPELLKLDRYERRAAAVRERSVRTITGRIKLIPERVLAPQRGLKSIGPVLRGWFAVIFFACAAAQTVHPAVRE